MFYISACLFIFMNKGKMPGKKAEKIENGGEVENICSDFSRYCKWLRVLFGKTSPKEIMKLKKSKNEVYEHIKKILKKFMEVN